MDFRNKKIHMVGIGGIGMSGLSFILAEWGASVSGSDALENNIVKELREKGVDFNIGHRESHVKDKDLVVFSSSIKKDNPEILAAKKNGIPIIPRIELLKMVMDRYKRQVAVTGTHGKTTTTAMSSLLLEEAGFDPTVLIGGESPHFSGNAKLGKGDTLVAEVDESDGRFVILRPTHIIVPNLEKEHLEHYKDESHLVAVFRQFLDSQSKETIFFYRIEDANLRHLASSYKGKSVSFGFTEEADTRAACIDIGAFRIDFSCFYKTKPLGRFVLNVPGVHNVLNSLAVISLGMELGIDLNVIKRAASSYKNVKRRFETIGIIGGARIVEDYAHHPTEIKATIRAAYSLKPKRIISVFQPHRYTRTKSFYKEFSGSFAGSSEVILTEVYSASEDKIEGVSVKNIYDCMVKDGSVPVRLIEKEKIPEYLLKIIKDGDLVLIMGAGDIGKAAHRLVGMGKK